MKRTRNESGSDKHGIRIPGVILDQIRGKEGSGEYKEDSRVFEDYANIKGKERVSRKEQRKRDRLHKKRKREYVVQEDVGGGKRKANPIPKKVSHSSRKPSQVLDEPSDEFEGFLDNERPHEKHTDDFGSEEEEKEGDWNANDFNSEVSDLEEEEDPLARLRALKEQKIMAKDRIDQRKAKEKKPIRGIKQERQLRVSHNTDDSMTRDEQDMAFYAKKLGLKSGKKGKLTKMDDNDEIGGLLDGIELDLEGSESEQSEESDLGDGSPDLSSDEELADSDIDTAKQKENPYVAPGENNVMVKKGEAAGSYIPPAIRRRMANDTTAESADLQKAIKSSLNKLSESNVGSITNDINMLFSMHPRQTLIESLTSIIIDSTMQQVRLLDTFVYLQGALASAIHKLQGLEFGAFFIQTLVERFEEKMAIGASKEASNIISLLSALYSFHLTSAKLLYDIIRDLISPLNEINADVLLRLVQTSGNQMRSEDPSSLKEIILLVNGSSDKENLSPRLQFLVDTISSLKNNKLKNRNDSVNDLIINLRKFISTVSNVTTDTLQISLEDIRNIETRGKWWLVGAAWKGSDSNRMEANFDQAAVTEALDNAEPNWMQLAKFQRINTDVRRAIFISIMSASDYIDSLTKLEKLRLKKSQEREIPKMLIYCTSIESSWNPYYGVLASKLCESHTHRKTLQFILWDALKEMDDSHDDGEDINKLLDFNSTTDDTKMQKIFNLGRLFGFLMAEGALQLHLLRVINFLTAAPDVIVFLEILFVTFFDRAARIAKKGSTKGITSSTFDRASENREIIIFERLLKAKEEKVLLQGIQYFIENNVRKSSLIDKSSTRKRVEWGINSTIDFIEEFTKN